MSTIVQKFGGSSLSDLDAIARVSRRIADTASAGDEVVVVVSAMGDTTDDLIDICRQITPNPDRREVDQLLATGEIMSMTLLAISLAAMGIPARSFNGQQAGIISREIHDHSRIVDVRPDQIRNALSEGKVALVAGFQGVDEMSGDVTTLGRGGSDTTAVALAAALHATVCEIYTDVEGVYTADPRIVPTATKLEWVGYDDMLEFAAHGCKVLLHRCVEYARNYQVPIHVRSSFISDTGTWVGRNPDIGDVAEVPAPRLRISGVTHDTSRARLTVNAIRDLNGGSMNELLRTIAAAGLLIDSAQTSTADSESGTFDAVMVLARADGPRAVELLTVAQPILGFESVAYDDNVASVAVIGTGMRSNPAAALRFVTALADSGAGADSIVVSDKAISIAIDSVFLPSLVRGLHSSFDLDCRGARAVVHGGTGR